MKSSLSWDLQQGIKFLIIMLIYLYIYIWYGYLYICIHPIVLYASYKVLVARPKKEMKILSNELNILSPKPLWNRHSFGYINNLTFA